MHGLQGPDKISTAEYKFYDAVIPSGFDLNEFEFREDKEDYFMMCGRMVWSKGIDIASQVCQKLGVKLVLAGTSYGPADCNLGNEWPPHVEYVGYADVEKRKRLMAGAKGLFCPTIYNEPFGYVAIEAMLSGTPVITVDWGAFTETVQHGVTGFRCRTFEQFLWAAKNIDTISPRACREWAEENYNFKKIGGMYKEYFESIINVSKGTGWYTENSERRELEWLTKTQPVHPKSFKEVLNQYNRIKNDKVHFLQIGAMDGVKHDDLYPYVMSYDWTGVLVEPLPDMFDKLVENYSLKDGLKFENSAIADTEEVTIYRVPKDKIGVDGVPDWAEGCSTMLPANHIDEIVPHMVAENVVGITIPKLYEKYGRQYDFIQIDTEGYDYIIFMQLLEQGLTADLYKIEVAHITYTKTVWMRWRLEQLGYKTFIDNYDLIAYRF
jgi:FkbM family methyltransferase